MIKDIVNDPRAYHIKPSQLALTPQELEQRSAARAKEQARKEWEERTYKKLQREIFSEQAAEPVKAEPAAEPVKAEPVKAEPVKAEPVKAEPVKAKTKVHKETKVTVKCAICDEFKPVNEFPAYKGGGLRTRCHLCNSKYYSYRYQVRKRVKLLRATGAVAESAVERAVAKEIFPEHWRNVLKLSKTL